MPSICPLNTLYAIANSHYWPLEKLQAWADCIISQVASPKPWLVALSLATTVEEAESAILLELAGIGDSTYYLMIGFYYLQYLDNPQLEQQIHYKVFSIYDACFHAEKPELHTPANRKHAQLSQAALEKLLSVTLITDDYEQFSF